MPPRLAPKLVSLLPPLILPRPATYLPIRTIRSIDKSKRLTRFDRSPDLATLTSSQDAALERKAYTLPPRTGVLGVKKGMSAVYDSEGTRRPCTLVQLDRVQVIAHRTRDKNGYFAVQIGAGWRDPENVGRAMEGHYATAKVAPKRALAEFRVKDASGLLPLGSHLTAGWFRTGQYVDTRANCKGKGFAGGMKRHGFKGQPRSHGVSLAHRSLGSAGQSQGGGSRVYPGKKMAGNMGGQQVTVQNVEVLGVDEPNGLLVLNGESVSHSRDDLTGAGCIAGPNGCYVQVQDALKKPWPDNVPISVEALPVETAPVAPTS